MNYNRRNKIQNKKYKEYFEKRSRKIRQENDWIRDKRDTRNIKKEPALTMEIHQRNRREETTWKGVSKK